jgi:protein-S-isoprenylcysteine O-methyltransferase Ste14
MKMRAVLGSLLFLVVAPGTVCILLPWLITGWRATPGSPARIVVGWVLVAAGGAVLLQAFLRFVVEGLGTPAPVAETERLVVGGLYQWVRNPMYLAVVTVLAGEALVLGSWPLAGYAVFVAVAQATFVRGYEEPRLLQRFGADYQQYRSSVSAWLPRRP